MDKAKKLHPDSIQVKLWLVWVNKMKADSHWDLNAVTSSIFVTGKSVHKNGWMDEDSLKNVCTY